MLSREAIEKWMFGHATVMTVATFLGLVWFSSFLMGLFALFSFSVFYYRNKSAVRSFDFIGEPANLVTTLRLMITVGVLLLAPQLSHGQIGLLAFLVLLADGLDGYLARRYKCSSAFGAYLDMETDALLVWSLCFLLYQFNMLDGWILIVGFLRYGYFLFIYLVKPKQQPERRVFAARVIAVLLMLSLIACFVFPPQIYRPLVFLAALLIFYSFGADLWYIARKIQKSC